MNISKILILISTVCLISNILGLSTNRTEISAWKKISQSDPQPKASDEVLMEDIDLKAIDDGIKTLKEKKLLNYDIKPDKNSFKRNLKNDTSSHIKLYSEFDSILNNIDKILYVPETDSPKKNPLITILILVDGLDNLNLQVNTDVLATFPIKGYLQTCRVSSARYRFGEINEDCDCDELLRTSISSLLSWALIKKGMMAGSNYDMRKTISKSNIQKDIEDIERYIHFEMERLSQKFQNWPENDERPIPLSETNENYKEIWRLNEFMKQLKQAYSLTYNYLMKNVDDDANIFDFVATTNLLLDQLNKVSIEKECILVLKTNIHEYSSALDLFKNYVQLSNALIIITSTCSYDKGAVVPYFARGPGSEQLMNVQQLYLLPNAVRKIISDRIPDDNDEDDPRNVQAKPIYNPDIPPTLNDEMESSRKRFAREDVTLSQTSITESPSTTEKQANTTIIVAPKSLDKPLASNDTQIAIQPNVRTFADNAQVTSNNSPKLTSYSTLIIAEILIIVTNFALKF